MLDALEITEEEAQGLSEIAALDLAMARDFARRAQAAEGADEANRLARSYQRAARSFRQTLALKVKLKRDLAAAAMAVAGVPRARPGGGAIARRIGELRSALTRVAWDEAERPEEERPEEGGFRDRPDAGSHDEELFGWHMEEVAACLGEACLEDSFCDEPVDDHVARLGLEMGFAPDRLVRWRDLPDPPPAALGPRFAADQEDDPSDPPAWRSSA